jgi:peptidoglycan/LPS O-acetylase OafA/YrhL
MGADGRIDVLAWPALAFYAYLVANGASDQFLYRGGWTLVAIAVAIMILASLESNWVVIRFLRFGPLRLIGRVSYGLYIWHLAIFSAVVHYGSHWESNARLVTGLGLTALACWFSWTFVEQPFREHAPLVRAGARTTRAHPAMIVARPPTTVARPTAGRRRRQS